MIVVSFQDHGASGSAVPAEVHARIVDNCDSSELVAGLTDVTHRSTPKHHITAQYRLFPRARGSSAHPMCIKRAGRSRRPRAQLRACSSCDTTQDRDRGSRRIDLTCTITPAAYLRVQHVVAARLKLCQKGGVTTPTTPGSPSPGEKSRAAPLISRRGSTGRARTRLSHGAMRS